MPTVVVNSTENTVTVVNSEKRIVVSDSVARGPTGATGVQGSVGTQGATGNTGSQGATGTQGTLGDPGLVWFGTWNQNEVYGVRQVVQYNGSSYVAVALNVGVVPVGNSGQWNLVSSIGAQGATGLQGTTGVKGDTGEFGGAVFDYVYFTNTSNTDPGTANVTFNSTDLANANTLFIDFIDSNGSNSFNYLQTIDDSTSAIKGTFKISNSANTLEFAYFNINGSHGHTANYFFVPIAHLNGVTSFNDATNVTLTFARTGDKGDTGTQGVQGTEGTQGPLGTQGTSGLQGSTGAQGALGVQGSIGAGTQGAEGPQGVAGPGGTGPQGATGIQGVNGAQGADGAIGSTGSQGATGAGTQGATGGTGPQGTTGVQGVQGAAGGGGATIAAPNGAILFANAAGAANGTNNFFFNVASIRMGIGSNTPNSNIVVVGNAWITTGINSATINVSTANVTNAVIGNATITTVNVSTANVSGTLTMSGATFGDMSGANSVTSNTYIANANIRALQYTLSTVPGNLAITQGSTVNINNFSGMIIVNNWTSGGIQMWLVGGGTVGNVGNTLDLTISNTGSITHSSPNYVWTAANTATYGFATIKTRDAG